ncbi:AMP-binding protein [Micromonospora sp. NPDC047812]|uniref:AMP-binding protein n=1 Tax=Micromonospora sp. NPDC047812 TaxID=3155742 RepID=UPI003455B29F
MIHTSGSAGQPKGVVVEQRAAVWLASWACWAASTIGADRLRRVLSATSLSLDVSLFELLGPLTCRGYVEVVRDLLALAQSSSAGSLISTAPTAMTGIPAIAEAPPVAQTVVLAGEASTAPALRALRSAVSGCGMTNAHGPTETTVQVKAGDATEGPDLGDGPLPIGRPLPDVRCSFWTMRLGRYR